MTRSLRLIGIGGVLALAWSCVSIDDNTAFLLAKLSEPAKARALVAEGLDLYHSAITVKAQYDRIAEIREYFATANRFDPNNTDAKKYLLLLDDLKRTEFQESLSTAKRLLAKKNRTADEDYTLVMATQQANRFDPNAVDAQKLAQDTQMIGANLAKTNMDRANDIIQKLGPEPSAVAKEAGYIQAFPFADRAKQLAPNSGEAAALRDRVAAELGKSLQARLADAGTLLSAGSFQPADKTVAAAEALNQQIAGNYQTDIANQRYNIYFKWAQFHANRQEWDTASARIAVALANKKTPEALDLDRTIADRKTQNDQGPAFAAQLTVIDNLLSRADWADAQARINAIAKNAKDTTQETALSDRRKTIQNALPDLYNRGVQAYRAENFKAAIDLLSALTTVAPGYQDAADYLRKAREKQQIIDQF